LSGSFDRELAELAKYVESLEARPASDQPADESKTAQGEKRQQ
jgi:hypothetical protein